MEASLGPVRVKICGVRDRATVDAVAEEGGAYVGFVFYPKSPRAIDATTAAALAAHAPAGLCKVGLFVDPDDAAIETILTEAPLDMIQLHGAETPARIGAVRARFGLPVMKAVKIAAASDLPALAEAEAAADQILCDAKPAKSGELPGGNGVAFDWRLIADRAWSRPWMLAGGLTPDNVAEAIRLTGARQIDLSSGVERAPGVKDPTLIRRFFDATRAATGSSRQSAHTPL